MFICRNGLIIASGTSFECNGAVDGKGIYLCTKACISQRYADLGYGPYYQQRKSSKAKFITSDNLACLALCEVITSNSLKKIDNCNLLCTDPNHVCLRFLFVYEEGLFLEDWNIDTLIPNYLDPIHAACGLIQQ